MNQIVVVEKRSVRTRAVVFWTLLLGILMGTIYALSGMLLPFVVGLALAYLLDPVADWLETKGLSRMAAVGIISIGFFLLAVLAALLILPALIGQIVDFFTHLPDYLTRLRQLALSLAGYVPPEAVELVLGPGGNLQDWLSGNGGASTAAGSDFMVKAAQGASQWALGLLQGVLSGGRVIAQLLSLLFIAPVVCFYLLRDWGQFVAKVDSWLPRLHAQVIREQLGLMERALSGFARGQATVCVCLALIYGIGWSLTGLKFGLFIGLATGLCAFVPYVGALAGGVTAVALAFVQFGPEAGAVGAVIAVFVGAQALDAVFLTPRLVGDGAGLHPVWVLFALMAGGSLFGFVGVLLAVPFAAVVAVLIRFLLQKYLDSALFGGGPPPAGEGPRAAP